MSRARSVSQLVGANTALGNTIITGTISTSTNTATFGTAAYHVANGNLGINTSSPSTGLHVNLPTGNGVVDSVKGIYVSNANNSVGSTAGLGFVFTGSSGGGAPVAGIVAIQQDTTQASADLAFHTRTSSGGGGTYERMRIDSSGRVTMSYQPRFDVTGGAGSPGYGSGEWGSGWSWSANVNVGSNFNASTGRFTAPVSGTYLFYIEATPSTTGQVARSRVRKNGSDIYAISPNGPRQIRGDTNAESIWGLWMIQLSVGDYVSGYSEQNVSRESAYSTIGGYLIG